MRKTGSGRGIEASLSNDLASVAPGAERRTSLAPGSVTDQIPFRSEFCGRFLCAAAIRCETGVCLMTSYTFRDSIFDTATTHLIQGDELILRRGDGFEEFIRLSEIRSVRLRSGRTGEDCAWQECIVRTAHCKIRLRSLHRVGFRRFESRLESYHPFVAALHQALLPFADNVRFVWGSRHAIADVMTSFVRRRGAAAYDPAELMRRCLV